MTFTIKDVNYTVATDGSVFTVTKDGDSTPIFSAPVDKTKTPTDAMSEVVAAANTFLVGAFPSLTLQFIAEFLELFTKLVVTVTDGVPVISITA
jgi:hypothetical protein